MTVIEGRGFYQGTLQPLALDIEAGVIREVRRTLPGAERWDFGSRLLLPGGVDVHVHFRDPGLTHKEDFGTGTEAAALGGITTVLDMPNTVPPATSVAALRAKRDLVARKAHVDFGLYAGVESSIVPEGLEDQCHAFKLYLTESFGGAAVATEELPAVLAALATRPRLLSVHAEDPAALRPETATSLKQYRLARPAEAEVQAIHRLAAGAPPASVHIAHLSSAAGLKAMRTTPFTAEVTPMHLLLDATAALGARGKVNPPLRTPEDREALWAAFQAGHLPLLASDHAPHTLEEKEDFATAPPGAPNVETLYPLLLPFVRRGRLPLEVLVNALATTPARRFGLGTKGALEVGRDADVVVVDPRQIRRITPERLHSKCGWSPFEGWEAIFPHAVFLRGTLIAREGELEEGRQGRPLPPPTG